MALDAVGEDRAQAGMIELLWGLRERPTRGPKPALSVARIAEVAVGIADAEGLAAVSMQRVAGELDYTKMSLYRYVAGKAELVAAMIDLAVGEPPDLMRVPGGWRPRLEQWAHLMWETWDRHSWLPGATLGERVMGPRELGWTEVAVAALRDTPLSAGERLDAVFLLSGHIRTSQSRSSAGTFPWSTHKRLTPAFAGLLQEYADDYPAILGAVSDSGDGRVVDPREFGLRCILDGLELLAAERPR